jgi:hypothetical protein
MFSSPKQLCKRLLSVLLALTFVASPIAVIAEDAVALADAARSSTPLAVVFAASDFQPRRISDPGDTTGLVTYDGGRSIIAGISQMEAIADQVIDAYGADAVTGALFCGDYSNESKYRFEGTDKPYSNAVAITNDGINAVRKVLGNKFNLLSEEIVMIQGNHDFFLTPLATTNAHDTEQYASVFLLHSPIPSFPRCTRSFSRRRWSRDVTADSVSPVSFASSAMGTA